MISEISPRHRDELLRRLELLLDLGAVAIRHGELKRWFKRERITKSVWLDVLEIWKEVSGESYTLFVGWNSENWMVIIGDGVSATKNSFWKDMRKLAS